MKELTVLLIDNNHEMLSALQVKTDKAINKELIETAILNAVKALGYELRSWHVIDSADDLEQLLAKGPRP
jgi:hypothetical protein